jgi:FG-GAP repeat
LVYTISDPNWQIARLGDFNGDGTADIVWRNSANGAIVAWFMNGGTIASNQYVYSVSDPNWQMY